MNATARDSPLPVDVAALCGSMRGRESFTRKALVIALAEVEAAGATVDLIDLSDLDLPHREGPRDREDHPDTVELKRRVMDHIRDEAMKAVAAHEG